MSTQKNICTNTHCKAKLTENDSVTREYVNKDSLDANDNVFAQGHYTDDGEFINDSFNGFDGGRFDLLDDSDTCSTCNHKL
jgi:hypothetical protein